MTAQDLLAKARSMIAAPITYGLGSGGINPEAPTPANREGLLDCSGFLCWCLGLSRMTKHPLYMSVNGGWINTNSICYDALSSSGFFRVCDTIVPGSIVVVGAAKGLRKVGHVAIVSEVQDGQPTKIIHCSSGNQAKYGYAIAETAATYFLRQPDTLYCWYEGISG